MRKKICIFGILSLFLGLAACSRYRPIVERNARAAGRAEERATWEAMFGTIPPTDPFDPLGNIEKRFCGMFSCKTGTPTPLGTSTPNPTVLGTIEPKVVVINGQGKQWVRYYSSSTMMEGERLGVLSNGSSWDVISAGAGDDNLPIQFSIKAWVPETDFLIFGVNAQLNPCEVLKHPWEHVGGMIDCHAHGWNRSGDIRAQIPPGITGQLISETATNQNYRDTRTGERTYGPGWVILFEQEAWIPDENGDLQ